MAQANSGSGARARPREQFWLGHIRACRKQALSLSGYAKAHGLSLSALYTAHATLKRRGVLDCAPASAPTFVPVRLAPAGAAYRVHLPNGVVVEVPASHEPGACAAVLECASRLS